MKIADNKNVNIKHNADRIKDGANITEIAEISISISKKTTEYIYIIACTIVRSK
jgi:hypothetical protein